ncbi:MAG: TIGR03960 family B12-binding radical SAM protein [Clostridia bacterium]|nr:TIGR03960 family B12-binding radical SAM protein [Clostridia bacterium]
MNNKELLEIQNPTIYMGNEFNQVNKKLTNNMIRFAFCFPESYEIGMSYLGMKVLYNVLNLREDTYCERVFAPNLDMEAMMRKNNIELYGLETKDSIKNFDFISFTLLYELTYTNILNMLDLANVPLFAKDRGEEMPFVCAGGICAYNPEPLADFFDFFVLGEGEEVLNELMDVYNEWKAKKGTRKEYLDLIDTIEGIYVPSLYKTEYNENGTIKSFERLDKKEINIKKRIIKDFDTAIYPIKQIVPYTKIVHDRIMLEVFRGCIRGCRFCEAGYVYRPVRERSVKKLVELAKECVANTGFNQIALTSLSTSDYSHFYELTDCLIKELQDKKVSLSLPSLRIDSIEPELLDKISDIRKSGLTYAPEAGTQRLRNVINKNITEDNIIDACKITFEKGWSTVKLYFMLGLPTETYEDLDGIVNLANKVVGLYHKTRKGKLNLTVSVSTFVPKPFTAFQWSSQDSNELIHDKIEYLKKKLSNREISFNWNNDLTSMLEAFVTRGDRRISKTIYEAWKLGCKFDGSESTFRFDLWEQAFKNTNIDSCFYAKRKRELDEILPWDFINLGVTKKFLKSEFEKALREETTPNCRQQCNNCGVSTFKGGACFEN